MVALRSSYRFSRSTPPRRPGAVRALTWTDVTSNLGEDEDWVKTGTAANATTASMTSSRLFIADSCGRKSPEILRWPRESSMCRKSRGASRERRASVRRQTLCRSGTGGRRRGRNGAHNESLRRGSLVVEGITTDERHGRSGRGVDHADVTRHCDSDPLHPVVLGGDGRLQLQGVAFLDVLQHPKEAVAMRGDADVARRPREGRVLDPPCCEVEHRV